MSRAGLDVYLGSRLRTLILADGCEYLSKFPLTVDVIT